MKYRKNKLIFDDLLNFKPKNGTFVDLMGKYPFLKV